jgi:hypothetical protein
VSALLSRESAVVLDSSAPSEQRSERSRQVITASSGPTKEFERDPLMNRSSHVVDQDACNGSSIARGRDDGAGARAGSGAVNGGGASGAVVVINAAGKERGRA